MRKELPTGSWFSFCGLRAGTSDADVQAVLADAGLDVPLERISIADDGRSALAVISLTRSHFKNLLSRALTNQDGRPIQLNGRSLIPVTPQRSNET